MPRQVEQAREALGARLRELRRDAGLSGRQLAALAGWHFTKVSKLENGKQHPSDDDLRAWCHHCHAPGEAADLIASAHSVASMYQEWRRQGRAGMRRPQKAKTPVYERAKLFRIYEPTLIPGLFQTADYATWIMAHFIGFHDLPNDLDQAVAARMERRPPALSSSGPPAWPGRASWWPASRRGYLLGTQTNLTRLDHKTC